MSRGHRCGVPDCEYFNDSGPARYGLTSRYTAVPPQDALRIFLDQLAYWTAPAFVF